MVSGRVWGWVVRLGSDRRKEEVLEIRFPLRRNVVVLVSIAAVLCAISLAGQIAHHVWDVGIIEMFDVDEEANVPTWYSAALLAVAGGLAWLMGQNADTDRRYWYALAALLCAFSLDEVAGFHEHANSLRLGGVFGSLAYAWVVPAVAFVALVGVVFVSFLWRMDPRLRAGVMAAGVVYVGGALGLEFVEASLLIQPGNIQTLAKEVAATAQELLEMLGAILFIWALGRTLTQKTMSLVID